MTKAPEGREEHVRQEGQPETFSENREQSGKTSTSGFWREMVGDKHENINITDLPSQFVYSEVIFQEFLF